MDYQPNETYAAAFLALEEVSRKQMEALFRDFLNTDRRSSERKPVLYGESVGLFRTPRQVEACLGHLGYQPKDGGVIDTRSEVTDANGNRWHEVYGQTFYKQTKEPGTDHWPEQLSMTMFLLQGDFYLA